MLCRRSFRDLGELAQNSCMHSGHTCSSAHSARAALPSRRHSRSTFGGSIHELLLGTSGIMGLLLNFSDTGPSCSLAFRVFDTNPALPQESLSCQHIIVLWRYMGMSPHREQPCTLDSWGIYYYGFLIGRIEDDAVWESSCLGSFSGQSEVSILTLEVRP